jgi:hypothetical protein
MLRKLKSEIVVKNSGDCVRLRPSGMQLTSPDGDKPVVDEL